MRSILRLTVLAAATALVTLGLMPAALAAKPPPPPPPSNTVFTVDDFGAYEGSWTCGQSPPYPCSIVAGQIQFQIHGSNVPPNTAVTLGWQLVAGTATAGQDYSGPTSGTVGFPVNGYVAYVFVPLVNDGVTEPAEAFTFRFTSSSVPATISDTATGTISNGTQVPTDCTPTKVDIGTMYLDCTNRPATQHWHLRSICASIGGGDVFDGNIVTGNGRSTLDCGGYVQRPVFVIDP